MTTHRQNLSATGHLRNTTVLRTGITCSADHENIMIPQKFQRFSQHLLLVTFLQVSDPHRDIQNTDSIPVFHPQYPFQSFLHGITGALPLSVQHFSHHKLCLRCHSAKSSSGQFSASAYNPADMCPVSIIVIRKGTAFYKVGKSKQPSYQIRMISNSGIQHSNSHRLHTSCPTMQLFRHLYLFPYPLHLVPSP